VRKVLAVLAVVPVVAVPVVIAPAALAEGSGPHGRLACPSATIDTSYNTVGMGVGVTLPASGCAAREHRTFDLAATVTRMDNHGSHDVTERSTTCGPFRSASDAGPGQPAPDDSCDLSVLVNHPEVEAAQYDIDLTYPGADGQRTMSTVLFCRSGDGEAACETNAPPSERQSS
jgi:hypothetical protein